MVRGGRDPRRVRAGVQRRRRHRDDDCHRLQARRITGGELRLDDRVIGFASYRLRDGWVVLTHTEIDEECEGRGFGSRLAAGALEDIRRRGLEVAALCPFIARYIELHPELEELVAERYRAVGG